MSSSHSGGVDILANIERNLPERVTLGVCPICGDYSGAECAGTMSAPHEMVEMVDMEYVRDDLHRGAVRALTEAADELDLLGPGVTKDSTQWLAGLADRLRAAAGGR